MLPNTDAHGIRSTASLWVRLRHGADRAVVAEARTSARATVSTVARLILINGAPGSGKSTLAAALAQDSAMTLALDVDAIKHSLGRWHEDTEASGLQARALSLALAREHLASGHDVVLGQFLAQAVFIEQLEALAAALDVRFVELILDLEPRLLAERLAARRDAPSRTEHAVNNDLVGPDDAERLVESLEALHDTRPGAVWVDARGSVATALGRVRAALR